MLNFLFEVHDFHVLTLPVISASSHTCIPSVKTFFRSFNDSHSGFSALISMLRHILVNICIGFFAKSEMLTDDGYTHIVVARIFSCNLV